MIAIVLWLAQVAATPASVSRGETLFAQSCAVGYCHGSGGAAARGPRLRGRTFDRAYLGKVIRDGIPKTAMPGWKDRLSETDIAAVIDYVASLASASGDAAGPAVANVAAPVHDFEGPDEVKPGRALFYDATRSLRCSTCHQLGGFGTAAGPDLRKLAAKDSRSVEQTLRRGKPKNVRTVRLKNGDSFAALVVEQTPQIVKVYDLTATPPVLRSIQPAEVRSIAGGASWRHESVVQHYTRAELRQVLDYVLWMSGRK